MPPTPPLLTTLEVARILGVRPATVYAYVSRGLLSSHRNASGKGSLFDRAEVDMFLAARKQPTVPGIQTGITLIRGGKLLYRGHDAIQLASVASFEEIVSLLWTGERAYVDLPSDDTQRRLAEAVAAPLPAIARHTDRLRVAVAALAASDPLRFDTTPAAVTSTARALIGTMVDALPRATRRAGRATGPKSRKAVPTAPVAQRLWPRLTTRDATPGDHNVLNAALVLLADHDIAASTLAARVAASTRAHPYSVVGAGLAALDGPLHGAASGLAYPLLAESMSRPDPIGTIADKLRSGEPIPGFGHRLYPDGDPRATALLDIMGDTRARSAAERLAEIMRTRSGLRPNIDIALAALTLEYDMPAEAGETVFAIARTAGWIAHALEEYNDRPLRFRPSGEYVTPAPAESGNGKER
ncbi:citrate synthase family protein [Actinoplanes sp. Pm04-4]|uniref:citrate synthase (unknown stereospecificity) n=1 Tax=Paractinoplanes pyxinae TaxID=2997416 RepID=A0ABT4BAE1_9ACTN|nr:citrate synthase family protein [Actinoplanes pyxinae]MCY1143483.1 citrate synthase family protein [Actinoplanes pyxinae]